jgi:hypothetical protein
MITLKEAQALANSADAARRIAECTQNLERASEKIAEAAKKGKYSVEVEVPGTNPSDFIVEIQKLGFKAKLLSDHYDERPLNPCTISWFNY